MSATILHINKKLYLTIVLIVLVELNVINSQKANYRIVHSNNNYRRVYNSDNTNSDNDISQMKKRYVDPPPGCPSCGSGEINSQAAYDDNSVIPREMLEKFSEIESVDDFVREFLNNETIDPRDSILGGGELYGERSSAVKLLQATCSVENQTVSLVPETATNDSTIVYYPSCARVKRCSGCCTLRNDLLTCQPTEKVTLAVQVIKSQYAGSNNRLNYLGKELVLVDEHIKCKCDCAIKEHHCNQFQKYDKTQCKCICSNNDEQRKCLTQGELRIWDSKSCTCRCREIKDCTTGLFFDQNQCACTPIPSTGSSDSLKNYRRNFIIKAVPVIPSETTPYADT